MTRKFIPTTLLVAGLVSACAAPVTRQAPLDAALVEREARIQQALALRAQWRDQRRLNRVAFPLLLAARDFCREQAGGLLGFSYSNLYAFREGFQAAAREVLGVGERLRVIDVVPGGPAERAGLKVGDHWVALDGRPLPAGPGAVDQARRRLSQALARGGPVRLGIQRAGASSERVLTPVPGCAYPVILVNDDSVNAFADGRRVGVTSGMLRFVENDQELAIVVSHEIAHNAMGHMKKRVRNYALGSLFDILAAAYGVDTRGTFGGLGAQSYSKAFEAEADYVGLYIMARAGMEVAGSANFWRRMAVVSPGATQRALAVSHPSTPERYLAIERTTEEIRAKRARGLPLIPEFKNP